MSNIESLRRYLLSILVLTNKQFITECFKIIKKYHFSSKEIEVLTDVNKLNRSIISNNRYTYPILREVNFTGKTTESESHVNGNRRYYDEKYELNGKKYILCNDWYHLGTEKGNQRETRIPFISWILEVVSKKDSTGLDTPIL